MLLEEIGTLNSIPLLHQHRIIGLASLYWCRTPLLKKHIVNGTATLYQISMPLLGQHSGFFSKSRYCINILFFFRIIYRYQAKFLFVYLNSVIRSVLRYFSAFSIRLVSHYWTISPFLQSKIHRGEVRCFLMVVNKYVHQFLA